MNEVSPLLQAQYRGQTDEVRRIRKTLTSLTIFEACAIGETATVQQLLQRDARAHARISPDGFTPLQLASFFGHAETVAELLAANADPNQRSNNPMQLQALHSAAAGRHLEVAALLIKAGAEVNAEQHGGYTPLMAAEENQHAELIALLKAHAARTP